ncbi:MAG: HNH endonuclease signature motif containing protein [Nocardioidaceae bacterium]
MLAHPQKAVDLVAGVEPGTTSSGLVPGLDLNRADAVDVHDPPPWMREAVILRDAHCVFPGCTIDARCCDLDHIEPYVPPDDGRPPVQTSTANLACLCRRHHRLKTFTAWGCQRLPDGDYRWTDPYGHVHRVAPAG